MPTTYGGDNITFPDGSTQNTSPQTGFVNRIINGDMRIDQRNGGAAVTFAAGNGGAYVVDRFTSYRNTTGAYTLQKSSVAPAGFSNSLLFTVTSTDTSIATGEVVDIAQIIEGFNISDFGWGTASAQSVTMSFWVRSSVTGIFCCSIRNGTSNRSYIQQYTISASNTWQQVQLTFPGETTGTWSTDNTNGLILNWTLMAGATFQATAGIWNTTNTIATSSQTNLMATSGATFYITGVSLVKGSTALPWEFRSIGQELALCQRYTFVPCNKINNQTLGFGQAISTTAAQIYVRFPVEMRAAPSVSWSGGATDFITLTPTGTSSSNVTAVSIGTAAPNGCRVDITSAGMTAGTTTTVQVSAANSQIILSSEL